MQPDAAAIAGLTVDHIGIVVPDVAPYVASLRKQGFQVSDPVALAGNERPLNQFSAHCVFANGYLEISAPVRGMDNHLEPLLAHGPGPRILALKSDDAAADHRRLSGKGLADAPVHEASRVVSLAQGPATARFRWFATAPLVQGLLTVFVEHLDPRVVFADELRRHPNGAGRIESIVFGQAAAPLAPLADPARAVHPSAVFDPQQSAAIAAMTIGARTPSIVDLAGMAIHTTPPIARDEHARI